MSFGSGSRVGHYEIAEPLGSGGMGEVWRARDTKLEREVAIKTLPKALADDTERLGRFEREAKLLATLNHANIAAVFGLDEHEGTHYLAMELIEGETLEERLEGGAIPIEDALRIALQIAHALEAAHEKGVVHRDLKPANVMLTTGEQVKVLDFGLAKAFAGNPSEASPAHSPALSLAMTQQGIILGTAGYMSPEQASGQATDQRADIWAFGVVLFEMLSGQPLFSGETVPHVLADVLRAEPDWTKLPENLHPRLKLLLERCLDKRVRNRYHSIADVRVDIEKVLADPDGKDSGFMAPVAARRRPILPWLGAAVAVTAAVAALLAWLAWPQPPVKQIVRFSTPIDEFDAIPFLTIADDGSRIAYAHGEPSSIHVRDLSQFTAAPVPDTVDRTAGESTCFSPDGNWIAYVTTDRALRKARVEGGQGLTLVNDRDVGFTCDWAADGNIYFQSDGALSRVADTSRNVEPVTELDPEAGETDHLRPQLLPGGKALLFTAISGSDLNNIRIVVQDLESGERTTILEAAGMARFMSSEPGSTVGHIVYGQAGALYAAPFDVDRLRAGEVGSVLDSVFGAGPLTFAGTSSNGTLAYFSSDAPVSSLQRTRMISYVGRDGVPERASDHDREYAGISLSPDQRRSASSVFSPAAQTLAINVWVHEFEGGRLRNLTTEGINLNPVWTQPDGERLIFAQGARGLYSVPVDGSSDAVRIAELTEPLLPTAVHPDGSALVGHTDSASSDVWLLPLPEDVSVQDAVDPGELSYVADSGYDERQPSFSPDGRWLVYSSDKSGRDQIYVVPYPGPGPETLVSRDGGWHARWNPAGGELFYVNGDAMMRVEFDATTEFDPGTPEVLFRDPVLLELDYPQFGFDVSADGTRFVMLRPLETDEQQNRVYLNVVLNWSEELRELAPFPE